MSKIDLEDIHNKYERLQSLISILQMLVAEVAEVAGVPDDSLKNALLEIEIEMGENNERLKGFIREKGGVM